MSQWNIDVYGVALVLSDLGGQLGLEGGRFSDTIPYPLTDVWSLN